MVTCASAEQPHFDVGGAWQLVQEVKGQHKESVHVDNMDNTEVYTGMCLVTSCLLCSRRLYGKI